MDKAIEGAEPVHRVKGKPGPKPKIAAIEAPGIEFDTQSAHPLPFYKAQDYAMRVWDGQSVDVPRAERIERCMNALRGQNLPTDGIVFPS